MFSCNFLPLRLYYYLFVPNSVRNGIKRRVDLDGLCWLNTPHELGLSSPQCMIRGKTGLGSEPVFSSVREGLSKRRLRKGDKSKPLTVKVKQSRVGINGPGRIVLQKHTHGLGISKSGIAKQRISRPRLEPVFSSARAH